MSTKILDIETKPQPLKAIIHLKPEFEAPASYKDPAKIAAAILEKERKWAEDAALSALTGAILAIGIKDSLTGAYTILTGDECEILKQFWVIYNDNASDTYVGHNTHEFDLPFIIRRSWFHRITIPSFGVRHWEQIGFFDTMVMWSCKTRGDKYVTLDTLSLFLGTGKKLGSGEFFSVLYDRDKESAIAYLKYDLDLTEANARVLLPQLF